MRELRRSRVIVARGEIDLATSPMLRSELAAVLALRPTEITLDLHAVTFVDSSGLGVLVGALKRLRETDGERFVIVGAQDAVNRVFSVTGLDTLFELSRLLDATPHDAYGTRPSPRWLRASFEHLAFVLRHIGVELVLVGLLFFVRGRQAVGLRVHLGFGPFGVPRPRVGRVGSGIAILQASRDDSMVLVAVPIGRPRHTVWRAGRWGTTPVRAFGNDTESLTMPNRS